MRLRILGLVIGLVSVVASPTAGAQSIPSLPKIDNINFYFEAGGIVGSSDIGNDPSRNIGLGVFGWGFESSFDMSSPRWAKLELAVGYDQLFLRAKLDNKYVLRGAIRDLPSVSVYATSVSNGIFAGLGTGLVSLDNVFAYSGNTRAFSLGGDTFDLAAHVGYATRAGAFIELAYHVRFIGGVSYGMGAPTDGLPASIYIGGATISIGWQISLRSKISR